MPPAGLKTGSGAAITYFCMTISLLLYLAAMATASIVSDADTVIAPVYLVDDVVGFVPLAV